MQYGWKILLACGVLISCSNDSDLHPVAESFSSGSKLVDESRNGLSGDLALAEDLSRATTILQVGSVDGIGPDVFGDLRDIVAMEHRLYVLDAMASEVRVFSLSGEHLFSFGRRGDGPAEFRRAIALLPWRGDTLGVVSRSSITLFQLHSDSATAGRRIATGSSVPSVRDACASSRGAYVLSAEAQSLDRPIHFIAHDGSSRRSLGDFYPHGNWLVRNELSEGIIACGSTGDVAVAFHNLPYLLVYNSEGHRRQIVEVDNFRPRRIHEVYTDDGRPGVRGETQEYEDRMMSLVPLDAGIFLLQVGRFSAPSSEQPGFRPLVRLRTYVVASDSGTGAYVGTELPLVLDAAPDRLYGMRVHPDAPVPQLVAIAYSDGKDR